MGMLGIDMESRGRSEALHSPGKKNADRLSILSNWYFAMI
jgi:hypothetical protein